LVNIDMQPLSCSTAPFNCIILLLILNCLIQRVY